MVTEEEQKKNDKITKALKAVIISKVSVDNGAAGTRVQNLVKLLSSTARFNTSAYVFSNGKKFGDIFSTSERSRFVALDDYSTDRGIKKLKKLFFGKKTIRKIIDNEKPNLVIIYSVLSFRNIHFIKKICKKRKIKLVFDVVESRSLFCGHSLKTFFGYNLHNYLINHFFINKNTFGVICPTQFLYEFFTKKRRCMNVFFLPITMDVNLLPKHICRGSSDKLKFLYAGNPKNKIDLIVNIIKGFNLLDSEYQQKIELYICGISKNLIVDHEGLSEKEYQKSLIYTKYLGNMSKDELYRLMPHIDFSVMLRYPEKLFAKAGFPTKLSESFGCGIPMVANLSGDMKLYLKDGFNGFVSDSVSPESFKNALLHAVNISTAEYNKLSNNALRTAQTYLSNDIYEKGFSLFLARENVLYGKRN